MRAANSLLPLVASASLGMLTALLVVGGVVEVRDARQRSNLARDQQAAVTLASKEVLGLTSLRPHDLDAQLAELEQPLAGSFAQQFHGMADSFTEVVRKYGVASTSQVVSAGLTSLEGDTAEVLVAATARVSGKGHRKPVERSYRFRVSLTRTGSTWGVAGMALVA